MSEIQLNITMFFVESLANNSIITKDIAKLYDKYKFQAYKIAKASELYNHPIFIDGDIIKEVTCKRVLGLVLISKNTEEIDRIITTELIKIIKKGWKKLYNFLEKKAETKIKMKDIMIKFFNPNLTDDEINSIIVILLILCRTFNIEIDNDKDYNFFIETLYKTQKFYADDDINFKKAYNFERFNYDTISDKFFLKVKSIKHRIFNEYGVIKYVRDIYDIKDKEIKNYIDKLSMIFDTENMMFLSLCKDKIVKNKDIEELCAIYFLYARNQNKEEAIKFVVSGIYIKYLIKAYKEVKEYYFKNNKETLFLELEDYQNRISRYKEELSNIEKENNFLKIENKRLKVNYKNSIEKENIEFKKQLQQLQQQIEIHKQNEKELYALREDMFERNNEQPEVIEDEITNVPDVPVVIIGGYENWQRKLKESLPESFKFINGFQENFNTNILNNAKYVFFNTSYMNHATYYKTINYCKDKDTQIKYINLTSIDLVLKEISKKLKGK